MLLLLAYTAWLQRGKPGGRFRSRDHAPGTWCGGLVADLQRVLVICPRDGTFHAAADADACTEPACGAGSRTFIVRPYRPADEQAVYAVCLLTGDSGADGSHLYRDHPNVLGHRWVGPYVHLEPEHAFVLEDERGVCGYVLGALDSAAFYARFVTAWLPRVREQYTEPTGDPSCWTPSEVRHHRRRDRHRGGRPRRLIRGRDAEQRVIHDLYHPQTPPPELFRAYPSHAHIDLIGRAQGTRPDAALLAADQVAHRAPLMPASRPGMVRGPVQAAAAAVA